MKMFQASLRGPGLFRDYGPGVETPGYFQMSLRDIFGADALIVLGSSNLPGHSPCG